MKVTTLNKLKNYSNNNRSGYSRELTGIILIINALIENEAEK